MGFKTNCTKIWEKVDNNPFSLCWHNLRITRTEGQCLPTAASCIKNHSAVALWLFLRIIVNFSHSLRQLFDANWNQKIDILQGDRFNERRSPSILCGRALLSTAYIRCHMKMATAVERQNATRAKDDGWQALFKAADYRNLKLWTSE